MPKVIIAARRQSALTPERQRVRNMHLAAYKKAGGKRCSCCWQFKPPAAFGYCARATDQLFAECLDCTRLRILSRKAGGLPAWRALRDSLRSTAPAVTLAPDDGRPAVGRRELRQYRYKK